MGDQWSSGQELKGLGEPVKAGEIGDAPRVFGRLPVRVGKGWACWDLEQCDRELSSSLPAVWQWVTGSWLMY